MNPRNNDYWVGKIGEGHGEESTSCLKSRRFPTGETARFEKSSFGLWKSSSFWKVVVLPQEFVGWP